MEINLDLPLWPRQRMCLESPANDQFFGGASEGGKSYLGRVGTSLAGLQCEGLQMTLIRKKYDDILSNHLDGDKGYRSILYPLTSKGIVEITDKHIRFPKSNKLNFKHCQDERQFDSAQGNENQIVFVDESPQIKERLIRAFRGWCRMTPEHKARQPKFWQMKLPWMLQTGNPTGESVGYYRRNYVKARSSFEIEEVDGFLRQFVPSFAEDNKSVDLIAHKARLAAIGDDALARALDLGDWDAMTGDFFPEWDEERHVVSDFIPPYHWFRFRTFDWGTAEPFAVYWVAVSDGEPFKDKEGHERWFPRGAHIYYQEWYGCDPDDPAKGIRMRNEDMAQGIVNRSEYDYRKVPTLTDSLPFQDRGGETIAQIFQNNGVILTHGDTSRVPGWSQLRSRLIGIQIDSNSPEKTPMIFFCACCKYARDYIPALPRHPSESKKEDAAEHGEATHSPDAIRLGCMAHSIIKDRLEPIQSRIEKELHARRPTIKRITRSMGHAYFN